jgi:putative nucleotidyltransferase with HDIG domain
MDKAHEIVNNLHTLKTLPSIAMNLFQLTAEAEVSFQEIEQLLRLDPVLVARVLRMVNSAYYQLRHPVSSLTKAIVVLGIKNLRNLVIIDALKNLFLSKNKNDDVSRRLWLHSSAVGVGAEMICRRVYRLPGEDAFLAGLLHDIGLLVEAQVYPQDFQAVMAYYRDSEMGLLACERAILGTDHCAVGCYLASVWQFPAVVQQAIIDHHQTLADTEALVALPGLIQVAHYIADVTGYSKITSRIETPEGIVAEHLQQEAAAYRALSRDFAAEMQKAAALYASEVS